jgi:hypothetical protein
MSDTYSDTVPVTMTLTFSVDRSAWATAYGLDPADVPDDVAYFLGNLVPSEVLPPSSGEWLADGGDGTTAVQVQG